MRDDQLGVGRAERRNRREHIAEHRAPEAGMHPLVPPRGVVLTGLKRSVERIGLPPVLGEGRLPGEVGGIGHEAKVAPGGRRFLTGFCMGCI